MIELIYVFTACERNCSSTSSLCGTVNTSFSLFLISSLIFSFDSPSYRLP
nr:MAG TPA: hypothetical protein [Caudoviricetes sp.]